MPGGAGTPGGYDGGSGSSSGSSGGRNGGGGGGGGEGGAAQRAAAQRAQEQLDADRLNAQRAAAAAEAEAEARETAREKAIQVAALTPKTIPETRHHSADTPLQVLEQQILDKDRPIEDLDELANFTGFDTSPKIDIKDIKGEVTDPDSGSYDPLLEALDDPKVDEGFKRYIRQVQQPIAPETSPGIGTTLKNIALGVVAPQLLAGTKFGTGLNLYNKYQTAKRYIPKIGDIETALRSNIRTPKNLLTRKSDDLVGTADWQGEKKRTTPREDRDGPKTTAETITTGTGLEEGQKMLGLNDAQQNYIRKIIAGKDRQELMMISGKAKIRIDSGEASQIEKDVFQMIQEYLV